MQKLRERRSINTPADVPQVCSPVALRRSDAGDGTVHRPALNSPEREGDGVVSLTISAMCTSSILPVIRERVLVSRLPKTKRMYPEMSSVGGERHPESTIKLRQAGGLRIF
jgi:hypothetical protein